MNLQSCVSVAGCAAQLILTRLASEKFSLPKAHSSSTVVLSWMMSCVNGSVMTVSNSISDALAPSKPLVIS